jgi:prepilin-type N-terminal cleavage/methylation domain-containing protein
MDERVPAEAGFSLIEVMVSVALLSIGVWISATAVIAYARVMHPIPYRDVALEEAQNVMTRALALSAYHAVGSYPSATTTYQSVTAVPPDQALVAAPVTYTVNVPGPDASPVPLTVHTSFVPAGPYGAGKFTVQVIYPNEPLPPPNGQLSDVYLVEEIPAPAYAPGTTINVRLPGEPMRM